MSGESVYLNYATALFDLVGKEESATYLDALRDIKKHFDDDPEFLELLSSYSIPKEKQMEIAEKVFGEYKLPHLVEFLKVILKHRRMAHFGEILSCFATLANEANQISEGLVYSARKLSPKDLKTLEATFTKKLGHQVILKNTVQSSLLGGVKVFLEGKVYDGSLRAKLLGLEKQLLNEGGNA